LGGALPGSAGCFKKPDQIPNAGHPNIYRKKYFSNLSKNAVDKFDERIRFFFNEKMQLSK
jgi:hypothetical protein